MTETGSEDGIPQGTVSEKTVSLERQRTTYISWLKQMRIDPLLPKNFVKNGGLMPANESLLYGLQSGATTDQKQHLGLELALQPLEKASFLHRVGTEVGFRPLSVVIHPDKIDRKLPEDVGRLFGKGDSIYLKRDSSAHGYHVTRITKGQDGYIIDDGVSTTRVRNLDEFALPSPEPGRPFEPLWIAEEAIPIAKTSEDRTWELRFLTPFRMTPEEVSPPGKFQILFPSPFGENAAYAKVGKSDKLVNNIGQGGDRARSIDILINVFQTRNPSMSTEEARIKSQAFLEEGYRIAALVKSLADTMQVAIAKQIVKPEDLKDATKYEEVIRTAFSGTFFCTDITGVWDDSSNLLPVIIEAQPHAGIPDFLTKALYPKCHEGIRSKLKILQEELK